jgi:twitching motility two-component system response regulator PilG
MTDSHIGFTETRRNILDYLKSLRLHQDNLDVQVQGVRKFGLLQVRQGQIVAAQCGKLQGNGALLTLAAMNGGEVHGMKSEEPVDKNVSVTLTQVERFFATQPAIPLESSCDEERTLQDAIQLFFQFRRKEAGAKLVEVLRSNRFYYPAWLWHSRLLTREDYIKKALNEAQKWGNVDPSIKKEIQKIEPQFSGLSATVRRCIFCWSLVKAGEECCDYCQGVQRISKIIKSGKSAFGEMQKTLSLYEEEMLRNPRNSRIAYCLCLGFCSLGHMDRAREFINKALKISPQEPLFVRTSAFLQPVQNPLEQNSAKTELEQQERVPKNSPVVRESLSANKETAEKTILVVEDSKTARKVVSMVLGRKGYKIIEATSGTEALLAIEGIAPDLVLLDVMLPDMTGYEVLSTIRKNSELSEVPVVMLTSKCGTADRLKGMVTGSNEYLTKPFDPAKLLVVLDKYLDPHNESAQAPQPHYGKKAESPSSEKLEPAAKAPVSKPAVSKPAVANPVVVKPVVNVAKPAVVPPKKNTEKSVLVVEDSPTSRKVISMVLSRKGYVVSEAATGGEAFRKVADEIPQLILLDAMLPDMTGYDILAKLKQDTRLKEIPVVMLTAKDSPVDREKGMRAGSVAYLTKPFNPDKLLSVIGNYI